MNVNNIKKNKYIKNKIRKYWKIFSAGILIAILPLILIDNWLPYALLSHHNFDVDSQPKIVKQFDADLEDITFRTDDDIKISGWWISAPNNSPDNSVNQQNPTLIVLHSLGGTRQDFLKFNLPIWQQGFNLALIDMRGHGRSGGKYFTYGYHERKDISQLIDYLQKEKASDKIVIMGISAGGAVAITSANYDKRIEALVSISAFSDLNQTIIKQVHWLPSFWRERALREAEKIADFQIQKVSPVEQIKSINCPIMIIHGTADKYIPFINAERLYNAAKGEKLLLPIKQANHNTVLKKNGRELQNKIIEFIIKSVQNS